MSNLQLYRIKKDIIRENLNKYTRKAYKFIPKIKNPNILDIGCGTGVPTIELAKLSGGHIIGLDIDKTSLNLLRRKIKDLGLANQVSVINDSIISMDFPENSFNIIWSEGSVFVMGFENSINQWNRFLKPNGFLIIHDEITDKTKKIESLKKHGYLLINQFELSENLWWRIYYTPLKRLIQKFLSKYPNDSQLKNELKKDMIEIEKCKSKSVVFSSFFVIMKKI